MQQQIETATQNKLPTNLSETERENEIELKGNWLAWGQQWAKGKISSLDKLLLCQSQVY